jgi:Protein of unknown function (DUF3099)
MPRGGENSDGMHHISRFGDPVEEGSARNPALITAAAPSFEEQHRARVRKYTIIMAFRIPALILAAIAYSTFSSALIAVLIIAISVPLPWIAVLIANDRPPRKKNEPSRYEYRRPPPPAIGGTSHTIEG